MITCSNTQSYEGIAFSDYLNYEGYSHSFLKYQRFGIVEPKEITLNMQVGSLVDGILSEPDKVDMAHPFYKSAKAIAYELQKKYGDLIKSFKKQVSYTGTLEYNGFTLPTKGRLDFKLDKVAVIDLKVTWSKDVKPLINYMGYANQLFGYCKMAGLNKGYIMIYSVPLRQTSIIEIPIGDTNQFWEEAIMNFGTLKPTMYVNR